MSVAFGTEKCDATKWNGYLRCQCQMVLATQNVDQSFQKQSQNEMMQITICVWAKCGWIGFDVFVCLNVVSTV